MKPTPALTRRSFLARCAAAAAAAGLPLWFVQRLQAEAGTAAAPTPPPSPNDRPGIALIGCGGRGRTDGTAAASYGDIVAVCDVDQDHREAAARQFTRNGRTPAKFSDFRALLERSDVQVIVQATPDHWHTLVNLAAARAGKDIYGEKPITLTIDEGKRAVRAVREHRVIFQTGSQQRSDPRFRLACELVRNGRIGKLRQVSVFVPAGYRGGPFSDAPVPAGLDWDRWLGQAPATAYQKERCHNTFRWWFEYSGGPVTDWGAHHNDIARWGIGLDGPTSVAAQVLTGPVPGGYSAPSEFAAELTWADGTRQVMKTTPDDAWNGSVINPKGQRNGVKFEGDGGWIWVNRSGIAASSEDLLHTPLPDNALRLEVSTNHMGNFFDSVRSRRDPICPIECGHRSASIGHLIVMALRSGRPFQWDPDREVCVGDGAEAGNAQLAREMRSPYDYRFAG